MILEPTLYLVLIKHLGNALKELEDLLERWGKTLKSGHLTPDSVLYFQDGIIETQNSIKTLKLLIKATQEKEIKITGEN